MADAQMLVPVEHDPFVDAGAIPGLMGKPDARPQGLGSAIGFGLPIGTFGGVAASRAADSVADAAMLPGDVYQGKADLNTEAGLGRVVNMAGTLAGAGMPMAEAGAMGIFGGRLAKTADLGALKEAEGLAAAGADRDAIWNKTGWFTGADGQWRFEIPDNKANLGNAFVDELMGSSGDRGSGYAKAAGALWHRDLYKAYPELRNTDVSANYSTTFPGNSGSYDRNLLGDPQITTRTNAVYGPQGTEGVLLHELQHSVQNIEGLSPGGNPDILSGIPQERRWQAAKEAYEASHGDAALLRELGVEVPETKLPPWDDLTQRERLKWLEAGRSRIYHQIAGEVEARNVQRRMEMTPEERRATPPWATQDVPFEQQIVRLPDGRTATMMSVDHDPFAPKMVPVDHDPFAAQNPPMGKNVADIVSGWKEKGVKIDAYDSSARPNLLTLSRIEVPKDARGQGIGSQAMQDLISHADEAGKTVALSPSKDFGASSVNRLKEFYKQFGFVENKGRNRDFTISESMYRPPRSKD